MGNEITPPVTTGTGEVPPAETGDTGTTPPGTGDVPEGETPETTAPTDGTGEPEAPAEDGAAEQTLQVDYDSGQTDNSTTTTTTTDTQDATKTAEDKTWDTFEQLMQKAEQGDKQALKTLEKMNHQPLADAADDLADQLKPKEKYASKEEADAQKKIYEKALSKQQFLDSMIKKYQTKASQHSEGSKKFDKWMKKANLLKPSLSKLQLKTSQFRQFQARQEDAKLAAQKKALDQVVQNKKPVPVKAGENAKTAGELKQGKSGLYGEAGSKTKTGRAKTAQKAGDEAAKKTADGKKAEGEQSKKAADTKETPEKAKPDLGDSEAEVVAAEKAVKANVPKEVADERLRVFKEAQAKMNAFKLAFGEATADLKAMDGEGAMEEGAKVLARVKEAGSRLQQGYTAKWESFKSGKSDGIVGLVHFDGKMADAVSTMETGLGEAVEGAETAMASLQRTFKGTREEVERGMAALRQTKEKFVSDFAPGNIYGYFAHWVPASERTHTVAADLKRDNLKHSVV